ncbi:PadR family transcriptional regulator [Pseudonocardiaceae bacterium YIM PH 21723]|nr:PadR family transcriptional regulator [Pseudonocardiaceae bacterium YIM PH 21723]
MWIEIVLLGKLDEGPAHGYELRKAIERATGMTLSNNSLYPALRRFVEAGAVTRSTEEQEAKPARNVYTLAEVGRELLLDMLTDFPADLARTDAEFYTRLANFSRLTPEQRRQVLAVRDEALAAERNRLGGLISAQVDSWNRALLDRICSQLDDERAWLAELGDRIVEEDCR